MQPTRQHADQWRDIVTKSDHASLHVSVYAPREPDPRQFTFQRNDTVGDAARTAADAFGYSSGNPSFQNADGEVLDRSRNLAAAHVRDGDTLQLVDVGGGV